MSGLQISYCFLDDDPCVVATRLQPLLAQRWARGAVVPLLAAPFHVPVPYQWDRFVP
jgi:hypothetical protein